MNTIDITPIVNAALALIGAGVSVFLIPWLKKQTTEAQRKELTAWVKIGVAAAEQLYVGQGRGEEKKQYVLDFLASMGFTVTRRPSTRPSRQQSTSLTAATCRWNNQHGAGHLARLYSARRRNTS